MQGNFDQCMEVVARWEGGWSDHPEDNGGATMYGITIGTLRAWRGRPVTKDDVRRLTKAEALEIYRAWYWQPVRGDDLPAGVDLVAFDAAVNSGPGRSARWLQQALNVRMDGVVGPATVAAACREDPAALIVAATQVRLTWLRGLDDWRHFGRGWTNRVEDVRSKALLMAAAPEPTAEPDPRPTCWQRVKTFLKGED